MHIYIDNGANPMPELQLPVDFWPELSRTNPFLTEEGSQSIPLTLPASKHNSQLIGFLDRRTSSKRPPKKIAAIFNDGTAWLRGTLFIESVNREEGISCTFYTNEGQLYETIKDYRLEDLDWPVVEGVGGDMTSKVKWWLNKFQDIMNNELTSEDYFVFAINTSSIFEVSKESKMDHFLLLNETNGKAPLTFLANDVRTYYTERGEDATPYTVPVGYGVTPFLKVGYILRHVMQYFGYVLDSNVFDTDVSLSRLVLLNNTADAIVNGTLSYKQLLPDEITVEDLINFVRTKFGVEFIQTGNHIQIRSWQENAVKNPDMDLSQYISNEPTFTLEDKRAISLKFELTNNDNSSFLSLDFQSDKELTHLAPSGYVEEKISITDKTPTYKTGTSGYISEEYNLTVFPKFLHINGIKNPNTELQITGTTETPDNEDEEIGIVCGFALPSIQMDSSGTFVYQYFTGTIFSFDTKYNEWGTYSLVANESPWANVPGIEGGILGLKDNLYNKCYSNRDDMLKKANQELKYEAIIPSHIIATIDITTPKIVLGQKVMIERIDYVMGRPELCQITARTLHQYED